MNDSAITYSANGNATVETYGMDDFSIGTNDFGEALYDIGGVEMTEAQANENAHFYEADDDGYGNSGWDQDYEDDTLPAPMLEGLHRINDALGSEGAADWIADELLGIGESRMGEVMAATYMEKGEIQSHVNAVMIDLAADVGMDHNMLMDAMGEHIAFIRSAGSDMGMNELHQIITDAVTGHYHEAMTRWDRLRGVLRNYR